MTPNDPPSPRDAERAALDEASKRVMRAKKGELTIYQLVPVKRVRAPEYYDAIVLDARAAGEGPQDRLDLGGDA